MQSILLYQLNENNFNLIFFITFSESQEESTPKGKIDGESNAGENYKANDNNSERYI